jgi:HTH-type transcriptional regulator / antitoxin HipB
MSSMKDIVLRNSEQLGRTIRLKRQETGLSQVALAARLGVERKWIIHLEAGNPKAEIGLVLKALGALGLSAQILDHANPRASMQRPKSSSRLDEVFRQLEPLDRK